MKIIESKSKVHQSRAKAVVAKVSTSSSTPAISPDVVELKDMVRSLLLDKKNQSSAPTLSSTPAPVKAVDPNCVTCGGPGTLPSNTITNPKEELKGITTRSGVASQGPTIPTPSKVVKQGTEVTKDQVQTPSSQSTEPVQPPIAQSEAQTPIYEPVVAHVSAPMPNLKSSIPYPLRPDNERRRDQANEQIEKFYEIFKDMSFDISFTDSLILMPKFASTLKALIGNKEKLSEMAKTSMNEHCSAVILNKLPRKLGDLGKFHIACEFPRMDECLALAYLGASINLMPLFVWEALSLLELTPTCMTLELADRSVFKPIGIAKDVSFKTGVFHFPADFVVVDFEPDPRVPLILERCFLKIDQALINVHKGELTLRIKNESITYNLDQTVRYSANYNQMTANKIDVIDRTCEEYSQEVLGFSDVTTSGNPTPYDDPIVSTTSPTLTPFGDSDFLLFEEADSFLELKVCEAKTVKSSVDEPPKVKLKDLPHHLKYTFLEGNNKLPVIIAKELGDEEKSALIKVFSNSIDPHDQEKTTLTCPYGTFSYRHMPFGLCNAPCTFQRCMLAIFHDMVENLMEVFMDDFSVFGNSFKNCLSRLDKMLQRVIHCLSTAYHPQTSGQVEVSNRGLKRILERTIGENRTSWSDKLDDALWAFCTAYKTPIRCTPYKLVYGKACHLPIELEHKAYWALKQVSFDLAIAGDHQKVQLNELNEIHDHTYENSLIYKEKTKRIYDSKIKNCIFNVGDRVLLFNSRLKIFSGKLKTRWSGPFTIAKVFPYGTFEISQANGPNFKVNGHRVKHYFGRDVSQLAVPDLQTFPMDQ
nr:reverse transcriptase domain-containing protein [Tanacetum cinerariifolium]